MRRVNAMRTRRAMPGASAILTVSLVIAAGAVDTAGSAGARTRPQARSAEACAGTAGLGLSDRRPRQLRPVRFSAAGSSVPGASVVFYDFSYGDGSDDATAQPTAVHAYQQPGTYVAKASILTTCNTIVSSAEYRVVVTDGLPPTVAIGSPKPNQVAHFGRAGLLLTGSARDPSGVKRVELAIQLLATRRSVTRSHPAVSEFAATAAVRAGCVWYDGHLKLRVRTCAKPLYFPAQLIGSRWSFRMNPRSQIPAGMYVARVRATDRLGNLSSVFSPQLGDILAFRLVA